MAPTNRYPLKQVSPRDVEFSDANPRGESEDKILKDETFERLKESVFRFGVLVPIVVHEQPARSGKRYKLIDGERRLRAALAAGVSRIPAHVAKLANASDEFVQAIHIHMLRKQWKPVAQAKAIRRLLHQRRKTDARVSERPTIAELQELTGCTDTKLKSLRRAARYPESVLTAVERGDIVFSHLVQFEESFIEQIEKYFPDLLKKFAKKAVREILVAKARRRVLTSSRALMNYVMPVIGRAESDEEKKFASGLLEEFIKNADMSAEEVQKRFEKKFPSAKEDVLRLMEEIHDLAERMTASLHELDTKEIGSFPQKAQEMAMALAELRTSIAEKSRRLSKVLE